MKRSPGVTSYTYHDLVFPAAECDTRARELGLMATGVIGEGAAY